jgi:hypothetical protein
MPVKDSQEHDLGVQQKKTLLGPLMGPRKRRSTLRALRAKKALDHKLRRREFTKSRRPRRPGSSRNWDRD